MSAGKKLNRAGTSTEIKITAVSLDKKNRQVYTVTVNRALEESASAASSPCFLTALQPSEGTLEPPFSPDILEYTLPVDSDVQSVTFQANASEGATVSINRKTLYKAGSTTEIVVTVRSEDRKTTKQYTVSVVRAEEGGSASERAGAGGTGMAGGNSGSNVAAKSNDGESPQSGEEPYIPFKVGETEEAAESAAEAGVPLGQTEEGTRETVFRENNQFFGFLWQEWLPQLSVLHWGWGWFSSMKRGKRKNYKKDLHFIWKCSIIISALTERVRKYRGVEQSGSSSGS